MEGPVDWADLVDLQVAERGSLAAVALHVAERRGFAEDVESVERGLRRLRARGAKPGGVWGERLLRACGLPAPLAARVRWMGQYHTRFTDLPVSLGAELLAAWDRPPISESPARVWTLLGRAGVAIRRRQSAAALLDQAALVAARAEPAARVELALVRAYVDGRLDPEGARHWLDVAETGLDDSEISQEDQACLRARLVDHCAWYLNRQPPLDHAAAAALYARLPTDGPPFARCRRATGLGWSLLKLGDRPAALAEAHTAVEAAGDGGLLRLRAMALNLLAHTAEESEAARARARAAAIAQRLEDEALQVRFGVRSAKT